MRKIKYTFRGWSKKQQDGNYLLLNKSNVKLFCEIMTEINNPYKTPYDVNYWMKHLYLYKIYMEPIQKAEFISRADKFNNDLQFKDKFSKMLNEKN